MNGSKTSGTVWVVRTERDWQTENWGVKVCQ
jgi:hypothetical protein